MAKRQRNSVNSCPPQADSWIKLFESGEFVSLKEGFKIFERHIGVEFRLHDGKIL